MTAVAERAGAPGLPAGPGLGTRIGWAVSDTLTITRRNLLVWMRVPAYLVFTVIQPVLFVLMFRYVFGGAIPVKVPGGYVDFLIPGNHRADRGVRHVRHGHRAGHGAEEGRDRPAAVDADGPLGGAGRAAGGRHRADDGDHPDHHRSRIRGRLPVPSTASARRWPWSLLAIVFGVAICCIAAYTGLAIGDEESVQAFGLIWLFPVTFVSSAFVPIATMPGWLQAFANNQPMTYVVNTMRALAIGGPVWPSLWKSLVWLIGIFVVFLPLAVRAYRRAS